MKVGLLFGTFGHIHLGHVQIAKELITHNMVDVIWFVVTPMNPFKKNQIISPKQHRIKMVNIAIKDHDSLIASDIEFDLPSPQYTASTLRHLQSVYKSWSFSIIMGSDTYSGIHKWKDSAFILNNFKFCLYQRGKNNINYDKNVYQIPGKKINISSSYIRKNIHLINHLEFLNSEVSEYVQRYNLYAENR